MKSDFAKKFTTCYEATEHAGLSAAFRLTSGETIRFVFSRDSPVRVRVIVMQYAQ